MSDVTSAATTNGKAKAHRAAFENEVIARLGFLPNFFHSAPDAPGLMTELWSFARSAFFDNPLPWAFKERLAIHLSRFCEVRYCLARHVGFLVGQGRPAKGAAAVASPSVEQAVRLLRWPRVPGNTDVDAAMSRLEAYPDPAPPPDPETQAEHDVFTAATVLFLEPARAARACNALRAALGGKNFELLAACIAFVRATHYWTLIHPGIPFEEDVEALLRDNHELSRLILEDPECGGGDMGQRLFDELMLLRSERDDREELRRALAERERAQKHLRLVVDELNHRVKNTLAVVQSLATQTMRDSAPEEAGEAFTSRLMALAQAHDALTREDWRGADLRGVIARAVGVQGDGTARVRAKGPAVQLNPKLTLSLSMAIHELTTNAIKYGALSNEAGRVDVTWSVAPGATGDWLRLRWQESEGPPVAPPTRKGFGSRLIERSLARELAGEVALCYEPTGVVCTIAAPLPAAEPPS